MQEFGKGVGSSLRGKEGQLLRALLAVTEGHREPLVLF